MLVLTPSMLVMAGRKLGSLLSEMTLARFCAAAMTGVGIAQSPLSIAACILPCPHRMKLTSSTKYGCREAELLDAALEIEQLLFWVDSWVAGAGFSSFGGRETSSF